MALVKEYKSGAGSPMGDEKVPLEGAKPPLTPVL